MGSFIYTWWYHILWKLWSLIHYKKNKKIIGNKNITANIYKIQVNDLMFGYFCIEFIKFMLEGKSLLDYTNLVSSNKYEKNDKTIMKYFQ